MADQDNISDGLGPGTVGPGPVVLDRSRARLRVPTDLFGELLKLAPAWAGTDSPTSDPDDAPTPESLERLAPLLTNGVLDGVAGELLGVVNQASLIVAVDVSYGPDASAATVWATPRLAVASTGIDRAQTELSLVPVNQLPQLLAHMIVLRSPGFVADRPLSVDAGTLSRALAQSTVDDAIEVLTGVGLQPESAHQLLQVHRPDVRRWRISSSWSTESGPEEAELRGLDAGPAGQWLEAADGPGQANGQHVFTPLGHGDGLSVLREVLPRNWLGVPLRHSAH